MNKPQLLKKDEKGGTIHSYELTGGKTTYSRFLSCYMGNCVFFSQIELAEKHLKNLA